MKRINLETIQGKLNRMEMKNILAGSGVEAICYTYPNANCIPGNACFIEGQVNTSCRIEGGLFCCRKW